MSLQRCRKKRLFANSEEMLIRSHRYLCSTWPQYGLSKTSNWSLLIWLFLTMRPPEDLIWALDVKMCVSKMSNLSFQNIIFPRMKPIPSSKYMHLKSHTATQSEKHYFYVDAIIIENHWFYTVISLSSGLWKVHVCNIVQTKPHYGSSKTHIKP